MLAVRLPAAGAPLELADLPLREPRGTAVRIAVSGCGVCRTDLHISRGAVSRVELPLTLGHEIAGRIDAIGSEAATPLREAGLRVGDPVVVFGGWGCGDCAECVAGEEQRCPHGRSPGFQEDGGYAEAVLVPHPRHLVALSDLDPVTAAPLADAGVTPYRAVRRAGPWLRPGSRVLLVGFGGLGEFAVQYLRRTDAGRIVVIEPRTARWERARELGADAMLPDLGETAVLAALDGPPDVVLDLVGSDETLEAGGSLVAPDGLLMLVGEAGGQRRFGFDAPLESWVTTTAWGSLADLRAVVELARAGEIRWTVETMPLAEAAAGLERLAGGDVAGRLVLVPPGTA